MSNYYHGHQQQTHTAHYVTLHTQTILLCHACLRAIAVTSSPVSPQQRAPNQSTEIYQRFLRITFCGLCRENEYARHAERERTHDGLVIPFSTRLQNAVERTTEVMGICLSDICIVGGSSGVVVMCVERCMQGVGDGARAWWVLAASAGGTGIVDREAEVAIFWNVPASGKRKRESSGQSRKEESSKEGKGSGVEYVYEDEYDTRRGTSRRYGGGEGMGKYGTKTKYFYEDPNGK